MTKPHLLKMLQFFITFLLCESAVVCGCMSVCAIAHPTSVLHYDSIFVQISTLL